MKTTLRQPHITAAIAGVLTTLPTMLYAQTFELESIQVTTATQTEKELKDVPASVEVIDEHQIQKMAAVTLQDALQYSGVFFNPAPGRYSNTNGQFSIRGVSSKGTLLLLNGRRIASEFTKSYDAMRIPASAIERIEIIKGPMGGLYGSDALGGVINIITKKPLEQIETTLTLSHGANGDGDGERSLFEADIRGTKGRTGFSAWISALKTGEYSENETAQIRVPKGSVANTKSKPSQSDLRIDPNTLKACGNGSSCASNFSVPVGNLIQDQYDQSVYYRDPSEVINLGVDLTHKLNNELDLNLNLGFMHEIRDTQGISQAYASNYTSAQSGDSLTFFNIPYAEHLDNRRYELGVGANWHPNPQLEIDWKSSLSRYEKKDQITSLLWEELGYAAEEESASLSGDGTVNQYQHSLKSSWLVRPDSRLVTGAEYIEDSREAAFFDASGKMTTKTQDSSAVYAQHEWQIDPELNLVYGLRYDDTSAAGDATSGHIGGVYHFSPLFNLRMRYAQGFRAPDSQENYINRYNPQGKRFVGAQVVDASINKSAFDLEAERSENYEIGLNGQSRKLHYDAALFYTEIDDSIVRYQTSDYISFRNASQVTLKGLDLNAQYQMTPKLNWNWNMSLLDSYNRDTGQKLEYTPDFRTSVAVNYQATPRLSTSVAAQYVSEQNYSITENGQTVTYEANGYTPVNIKFNYALDRADIFVGIDNLFETEIDNALGSDIGRYYYAGVRWFIQ
ncbi:TonB-dependent receptor plug domain-containing protein [Thiomicrorhabdus heinhorstiae]|uniref:TonB-dependent receptor n=1 Tax=Thiomicrorhabdus heinhorstiae TaxID=2748010 RepID=A0ABS0BU25_9GAMM|nr:TonB-dependent receptor [Thiomicrorhabdus heinhorstiae]MBF6057342.1 TonB-dependent receptor [Thiomicrorhabdus heinhorstiae]